MVRSGAAEPVEARPAESNLDLAARLGRQVDNAANAIAGQESQMMGLVIVRELEVQLARAREDEDGRLPRVFVRGHAHGIVHDAVPPHFRMRESALGKEPLHDGLVRMIDLWKLVEKG